jgi:peptidase M1-like protein
MKTILTLALLSASLAQPLSAQALAPVPSHSPAPVPATDESPFRRLELPPAGTIRTGSGAPGRDYWQQRADYVIQASLDTLGRSVAGEERITYTNNSPDTLRYLWLQLDQNLFNSSSRGAAIFAPSSRFGTAGANGGFTLTAVRQPALPAAPGRPARRAANLQHLVNGTMMRVELPSPLPPRTRYVMDISWSFPFGPNSNRMGIETVDGSVVFEVAQWYPRLAVYDDIRGWNTEQYLGQGEFYLEYGSFDVSLTVPANMIVAATGTLRNPLEVLTPAQRRRLAAARRSDTTVIIRGKDEIADRASRPRWDGTLTWRFAADSVRDFSWAAASHFIWDAAGVNGGRTVAMSFYPPSADSIWSQATQYAKTALERYSSQWFPYPYPYASNINGIEGGMEYPMIVFCSDRTSGPGLYGVTDHEFGHTWFPMVVGSNERLYPWQDEGFNTFINYYNWKAKYPALSNRRGDADSYLRVALSGREQPVMVPADRQPLLGHAGYNKPGLALRLLRDDVLGEDRFDPAFREYIRRWAWKHPTPADFFRTMEDGVGEDLSWFWRSWFYTTETVDQAVDSAWAAVDSAGARSMVALSNPGAMVMPVTLVLSLSDGSTRRLKLPVEIWYRGRRYTVTLPGAAKVTAAMVDPDSIYPDADRSNNRWPR